MKQISESDSDAKEGKVREIKWWNDNSIMEQNGVYLHGVCEPGGLYVEGRRSKVNKRGDYFACKLLLKLKKEKNVVYCTRFNLRGALFILVKVIKIGDD